MKRSFKDWLIWSDCAPFIVAVASVILTLFLVIGGAIAIARVKCSNYSEITNKETQFRVIGGCYIQTSKGWQNWEEYISRSTASEGLQD